MLFKDGVWSMRYVVDDVQRGGVLLFLILLNVVSLLWMHNCGISHIVACAPIMLRAGRYQEPAPRAVGIDLNMTSMCCRVGTTMNAALGWPRGLDALQSYGFGPKLPCGGLDDCFARAANVLNISSWLQTDDGGASCVHCRSTRFRWLGRSCSHLNSTSVLSHSEFACDPCVATLTCTDQT